MGQDDWTVYVDLLVISTLPFGLSKLSKSRERWDSVSINILVWCGKKLFQHWALDTNRLSKSYILE